MLTNIIDRSETLKVLASHGMKNLGQTPRIHISSKVAKNGDVL